ncbi:hypothetical protein HPP92_021972 [Vanilla planifolia]|uniref:Uncharacterized protein n=1 Tax=Vanilla planifolia TaxID=51239 RepID=A0A835PWK2_VANPL|nr:hypothetical protein HPP92_021972 [Vanilla planifolia]
MTTLASRDVVFMLGEGMHEVACLVLGWFSSRNTSMTKMALIELPSLLHGRWVGSRALLQHSLLHSSFVSSHWVDATAPAEPEVHKTLCKGLCLIDGTIHFKVLD